MGKLQAVRTVGVRRQSEKGFSGVKTGSKPAR